MRVFAGRDRVTGKRLNLTENIPAGTPNLLDVAVAARERLLEDVEARRHPHTDATVAVLLERYLSKWAGSESFLVTLEGYVRNHIVPLRIGHTKARAVDAELLDSFYAELARCRSHCVGDSFIEHRTTRPHTCDQRCRRHQCTGLSASTIRHIHHLFSGAYKKAKKWKWVSVNPVEDADPPPAPPSNPQPPTAQETATILNAAWRADEDWGTQVWLDMTTGLRRGEMCALRFSDLEFPPDMEEVPPDGEFPPRGDGEAVLQIERSIKKTKSGWIEGPTKTHQKRRIVLDRDTTSLLWGYWQRRSAQAALAGTTLAPDAFLFSPAVDHSTFYKPDSVTQRYARLVKRLGIETTVHKLRHYSATELILAGVDIRTVAGRLGHGGGGTTTLKVYAAFVSEADQRAATALHSRMPARPVLPSPAERATTQPRGPYETIAIDLRQQLLAGQFTEGDRVPPINELAATHGVSVGTAHRAVELLRTWNLITRGGRGRPSLFLAPPTDIAPAAAPQTGPHVEPPEPLADSDHAEELDLEMVHLGQSRTTIRTIADPTDTGQLLQLLSDFVRRSGGNLASIGDYEMVVRYAGERGVITTFVAPPPTRRTDTNLAASLAPAS